jgi:hypothetical protein
VATVVGRVRRANQTAPVPILTRWRAPGPALSSLARTAEVVGIEVSGGNGVGPTRMVMVVAAGDAD